MKRRSNIRVFADVHGIWYCSTKERLISAGLATEAMFPEGAEVWRGNGPTRGNGDALWAVSRTNGPEYLVLWRGADATEPMPHQ